MAKTLKADRKGNGTKNRMGGRIYAAQDGVTKAMGVTNASHPLQNLVKYTGKIHA